MRNILQTSRGSLFAWVSLVGVFLLGRVTFLESFSTEQQFTLLILVVAIYLWTASSMPSGAASVFVLALIIGFGVVEEAEMAFQGFLSTGLYFIVLLSLISQVLVKVGFDQVVARLFQRLSGGRLIRIMMMLPLIMLLLPIILPSAVARYKILYPLTVKINDLNGLRKRSAFHKFSLFCVSYINQKATYVVFTGGGFAVIAYQLMSDYGVGQLQWLEWFMLMAPPLWTSILLTSVIVWFYFKWSQNGQDELKLNQSKPKLDQDHKPSHEHFWPVVIAFSVMVLAWMVTDPTSVPIILPPMLLVAFYGLPRFGLVNNQVIRSFDWETFLLLGTSFSLGFIMAENGTAEMIAHGLIQLVPNGTYNWLMIVYFIFFIGILRMMFTNSTSAIVVIFPIILSYGDLVDISPVALAFLIIMVLGGMLLIPIHAPTTYYASQTGVYTRKEQLVIGVISGTVVSLVAGLAVFLYW
ncbi:SLC13 family permease [Alkalibacillus aidingensis]|uniref:SLC13 family permease n=1 Tax=Alkalibacillus aidingensis TaxID=2747607 RepID=UPI001660CDFC|nr:SLC13 family permease [Alkalibacillus aidingensis]